MNKTILCVLLIVFTAYHAHAEEDALKSLEKQHEELARKEEIIKEEMVRLKSLKKEVEEGIEKYSRLLKEIDKSLQQAEERGSKRLRHVAKAYEAMPPEDAAVRLSGLDEETAVQILMKMDSKKAGLVIGMMDSSKATEITKDLAKLKK